ncbi:MAG: class I adenylate-forming enzyme family protein [Halobacteriaceae archaeon]
MRDWPRQDLLRHRAASTPDRPALIDTATDTHHDVATLDARAGEIATALADVVDPGDRVAVLLPLGTRFVELFWAIARLGASVVPLNPDRPAEGIHTRLRRADVATVLCEADTAAIATSTADRRWYALESVDEDAVTTLSPGPGQAPPVDRSPTDELLVVFTSGTTGAPKGVRLTDANLLTSAIGSAMRLGVQPGDRWLDCLPIYHMGGLAPIIRTVVYGTTLVVQPGFDVETTATTLADADITGLSLVPTMLRRLLDADWNPPPSLSTVLLGGAPAGESLIERALAADIPVHPTYGLTEAASQVTTARPPEVADDPTTVGHPLLVTDVTIVDEDGRICAPGEIGEIVVDGPTVAPAYLDRDQTQAAYDDRGLHTGDLGRCDEAGRLTIYGRLDDRISTGGETVAPATVVDVLQRHPAIEAAAVVGVDDPDWGERVAALVVPAADADLTVEVVREHCRSQLAAFECPRTVAFADALPRTGSGTVDREAVRAQLRDVEADDRV